ncbi:hypothetical protein HMPREF9477_01255 [Lachnospiraceae bacterium 2_1_46FAA]|nr:hypothetical protein HMPREF9477_01255 [Lachnospiraceae bacterium 2_1_46FAA]
MILIPLERKNDAEVPEELVCFLKFVKADIKERQKDFHNEYVRKLQEFIKHIKKNREMEEKYMLFEELLKEERETGRKEGLQEGESIGMINSLTMLLKNFGEVPESLQKRISEEKNLETLNLWFQLAIQADSLEEFISKM